MAGIDRAAVVVAVAGDAGFGVELVGDFGPHAAEDRFLGLEPGRPVALVDLVGMHVMRHVGVPRLEIGSTLRIPGARNKESRGDHDQQHQHAPEKSE